ncbi:MAG: preprotein translocase subunit SecE [Anaerolineae bacterium]|nr:preprotein translocase subunit SecE [Anaerolineae bacterium]
MTVDEAPKAREESRRSRRSASTRGEQRPAARNNQERVPAKRKPQRDNIITRITRPVRNYFVSTRAELQKVTWPTRQETLRLSGIVIGVTVASSLALGVLDFLYGELFRLGFTNAILFVVFGIILAAVVVGGTLFLRRRSSF